ncbi:hypothetical protein ABZS68_38875 [Streptomyces sp. NPDC005571]|uniref:hypothetical protein n=1 Tax=unclassified Streptomyces TaxID=2593676 RepID=UPI0033AB338E
MAVGVVSLDPLRHFGLTLTWRLEGKRTRRGRGREAGMEHRLDAIRVLREILFVPGHQILKQVRERFRSGHDEVRQVEAVRALWAGGAPPVLAYEDVQLDALFPRPAT